MAEAGATYSDSAPRTYAFDLRCARRFWRLQAALFPAVFSVSTGLLLLVLTATGTEQFLAYRVGLVSGQFYKVLGDKDALGFRSAVLSSLAVIVAMTVVKSLRVYVTRVLSIAWRRLLTTQLHLKYLVGIRYYQLNVLDEEQIDNPDQRMATDVNIFCTKYGEIIADVLVAPFIIAYYSYSAYSRAGWVGPTGMFALFLVSTVINRVLMSPIVRLTVEQERREGDFRFKHVAVRVNSEALAFMGSAKNEASRLDDKLQKVLSVQQSLCTRQLLLDLAVNGFSYLGSIASFLVIAVPIFAGAYDSITPSDLSRIISENAFVCMYLVYQFSKLVEMSSSFSALAGVTHRIAELAEALSNLSQEEDPDTADDTDDADSSDESEDEICQTEEGKSGYAVTDLCVFAPRSESSLIANLTVDFKAGTNVLIMGRSSAGKSSLLRVLRGLWPVQRGRVECFAAGEQVAFLPQKPFFTDGSLWDQVTYPSEVAPSRMTPADDAWLSALLVELGMGDLVRRCGGALNVGLSWSDALSPGEMQRLAFVRLFFHRPALAFLDEATSALSADIERLLYLKCQALNITLISVGHREDLKAYHDKLLTVGLPNGDWKITDLAPSQ